MSGRHRRPRLPESDGLFAGIALLAANLAGAGVVIAGITGTPGASLSAPDGPPVTPDEAAQVSAPDDPPP
ncbi:hypothetical protein [Streptomyces aidingensis]|uniref:Uncharacterized protein n=1 Tax=Streptomyces aidingensis TaxID=910347 RepID=A0A1I1U115_9ACTN|nr:hypothetical protein [Streptomyces aidingensis]SFD61540.1 hypothetical protein SAMN05421773_1219 [Streptomyces aidingensis]